MAGPLAGFEGKPMLSSERPGKRFIGRIIVELYEGSYIEDDAHGLVMSLNPAIGVDISQGELLKRIAAALPGRATIREKSKPPEQS